MSRSRELTLNFSTINTLVILCALFMTPRLSADDLSDLINRTAIIDVLTQYSYRWDSKDSAGFAELFTEDGVLERSINGVTVNRSKIEGKEAIYNYAKTSHEGRLADTESRHHFSGVVFLELTETSALTENMALITHQTDESAAPYIRSSGYYLNTWQKTRNGWRIRKRVLKVDSGPN